MRDAVNRRLALLLPLLFGCASGREFEYEDRVAVKTAFVEVVKECYAGRTDGTLQPALIEGNRVRIAFQYKKEVDRADSETVDLTFKELYQQTGKKRIYRVVAYQPLGGPNRIMEEQTALIEGKLAERLGAKKGS
jgi:hypothetical protein